MWTTIMGRVMRESSGSASVAITRTLSPPLSTADRWRHNPGSEPLDIMRCTMLTKASTISHQKKEGHASCKAPVWPTEAEVGRFQRKSKNLLDLLGLLLHQGCILR